MNVMLAASMALLACGAVLYAFTGERQGTRLILAAGMLMTVGGVWLELKTKPYG